MTTHKSNARTAVKPLDLSPADATEIARLYAALEHVSEDHNPRTARLLAAGIDKMCKKLIEEAGEVALDALGGRRHGVIRESADLIYHLVVLWRECGVEPADVWVEMRRRADALGIAEKLPKTLKHHHAGRLARH
jgi:phosphoribosyl-ATP pyrophosphohydrolase